MTLRSLEAVIPERKILRWSLPLIRWQIQSPEGGRRRRLAAMAASAE
jgi:hypothetical protein